MSTRRAFLANTACAAAVGTAALPPVAIAGTHHPDAQLIRLAEQFIANEQAIHAEPCDEEPDTPEADQAEQRMRRLVTTQAVLTRQLDAVQATTADGIAARARCLAVHNADLAFAMDCPNTTTGRLARQLIRDAMPEGNTVTVTPSPDAALLEACAAFDALERAYVATFNGYDFDSPEEAAAEIERERLSEAQEPLVVRICQLRAVTLAGQAARARSLALWDGELMKPNTDGDASARLTTAIVRDLLALGGSAGA